jgi:hypothetical protein
MTGTCAATMRAAASRLGVTILDATWRMTGWPCSTDVIDVGSRIVESPETPQSRSRRRRFDVPDEAYGSTMKFFENVLSDDVLTLCDAERAAKLSGFGWRLSDFAWSKDILVGITGTCASTPVSVPLKKAIAGRISRYLPEHDDLLIQHYVWMRGSGISRHNDGKHRFGATIYLNRTWNSDYGGIFMWEPEDSGGDVRVACPTFNTMVLNDNRLIHSVTPVSTIAPEHRLTLQIWGV